MTSQVTVKKVKAGHVQASSIGGGRRLGVSGYASSVYAGAGGLGTRMSSSSLNIMVSRDSLQLGSQGRRIYGNEKETMKNLNERLSSYLEKVNLLEKSNAQLEEQIREWYSKNSGQIKGDYEHHFKVIKDLREQIMNGSMENASLVLQIDNARLAADDFKIKFDTEQTLRASTERDNFEMCKVIDQVTLAKAELEAQIENLNEELLYLKKNHDEEKAEILKLKSGGIDVEVDVAPSVSLGKVMEDMREQYEDIISKHRQEAKYWYDKKVEEWTEEVTVNTSELEKSKKELTELKQTQQTLEIESQSELTKKQAAEATLENVNAQYAMQLSDLQDKITHIETLLQKTRSDVNFQVSEFTLLLSLKSRLEAEIATYRKLLEGGASLIPK